MQDLSDAELVKRAQNGTAEAAGLLFDRHHTRIFRYVRARIYNTQLAQDLTGEIFLQMVANLNSYRVTSVPFSAWLHRIAHNHVVNHIGRKENRYEQIPLAWAGGFGRRGDNPASLVEIQMTLEEVQQALERIDETQREIIILRFWLGYSLKEVAEMLDKTVASIKSHQHRGLLALKVALK
jgi:RNA polymerase sigma-70 factor (ECF subfamily)